MACRAASCAKYSGVRSLLEEIELITAAAARIALLRNAALVAREGADAHARQRLPIEIQNAVAGGHHHLRGRYRHR